MPDSKFYKQNTAAGDSKKGIPSPKDLQIPKIVGPYKIECLLETGGMSTLYLGILPELHEPIAVKVLLPRFLSNPDIVHRFRNEAEIIGMMDHPNIVKLYSQGEWEGGLYIGMEFIQGISLRQMILQTPISLKKALEIIIDIAYALCHLHTHGVIHRDLKPENVLINQHGQVKVIDFGIAQILAEKTSDTQAIKQRTIGTPVYMSPEQREDPEAVSYPSDIYSLGIIAYELVLGKLSHGHIHLSLMPKGLQKILNKSLQPRPEDRYQDVVDFITDVSNYLYSSNLHKERAVEDQLSEFLESLRTAEGLLTPVHHPKWKDVNVGICSHKGINTFGVYNDFLVLLDGSYCVITGEATTKGPAGVVEMGVLSGMIKASYASITSPAQLASLLNQLVCSDTSQKHFVFNCLILSPQNNQLYYINCGGGALWKLSKNKTLPIQIGHSNPLLGASLDTSFTENITSWETEDTLLLSVFANEMAENNKKLPDNFFEHAFENYKPGEVTELVESTLQKTMLTFYQSFQDKTMTFIGLFRGQ